jgi:transcriptional regulator with GAF, ATPase, and Fis domain
VRQNKFRDDLFYRLNVFPIGVPPLRERPEDIPPLVQSFVHDFAISVGKAIEAVDKDSIESLQRYSWPGNIRELRNIVERAVILATGPRLHISVPSDSPHDEKPSLLHIDNEREHIRRVLDMTGWRVRGKGGAAQILGLKANTLDYKITRLGLARRFEDKAG